MSEQTQHIVPVATLIKAFSFAVVLAALALVLVVLPAEYNLDPTGIGKKLGLTQLTQSNDEANQPKAMSLANKSEATNDSPTEFATDVVTITVPAGKGLEYKFYLKQHANLTYQWQSDGPLYFDFHGEPEGDTTGYFESFTIATTDEMKGSLTTPFAGSHGWYWKNTTNAPINVTLNTQGHYKIIGLK
jgi:hypothetical protein